MWSAIGRLGVLGLALSAAMVSACRGSAGTVSPAASDGVGALSEGARGAVPPKRDIASIPTAVGITLPPGDPGAVDVTFAVHADQGTRAISPLIYGINHDIRDVANQRWGVVRSGGNRLTAYNWENNASNAGSDYMFQNDGSMSDSDVPALPLLRIIDAAALISAPTVITISNADYVSADKNGGGDVRASGSTYLKTRFRRNYAAKPTPLSALPDTTDDAVYQDEFVAYLKAQRPDARLMFSMDNEPELWFHTHAEIFPKPVTYADLWKRNYEFARAAKRVWPSAEVLGFVSYGYLGFVSLQKASDAQGRNFIAWYLDQARAAEKSSGLRLIDYLDLHWYPEAQGGGERILSESTSPEVWAAREQAPRSLWDPKYEEKSWVRDLAEGPIDLLHWVKAKIDVHYPGTKLSFTEWNFGGGNHISGAIAVADVLGIFGRFGVDLATYWPLVQNEPFAYAAFRVFRNFDNQGGHFGDISVTATSSDVPTATAYASLESKDAARTAIVVINKSTAMKRAGLKISHSIVYTTAKMYVLTGAKPELTAGPTIRSVATNAFKFDMPAQSVSVILPEP